MTGENLVRRIPKNIGTIINMCACFAHDTDHTFQPCSYRADDTQITFFQICADRLYYTDRGRPLCAKYTSRTDDTSQACPADAGRAHSSPPQMMQVNSADNLLNLNLQ